MPRFIDHHAKLPPMPPEAIQQMRLNIWGAKIDEFGVKAINAFMSTDGQGWCWTEGPNADAICKSHQAYGIPLDKGDVHEVQSVA